MKKDFFGDNYVADVIDKVQTILSETKANIGEDDFATAFNLMMCKNKLSNLLEAMTETE